MSITDRYINAVFHLLYYGSCHILRAFIVSFGFWFILNNIDLSVFPFVIHVDSVVLGLGLSIYLYFIVDFIVDVFRNPFVDYCSKFKNLKKRLVGAKNE